MCESANIHFSQKDDGEISEWVKDKGRGGNGRRDKEEERKLQKEEGWASGGDMNQGMSSGNSGQWGIAE